MINLIKAGGRYNTQIEEYEINTYSEISGIPGTAPVGSVVTVIDEMKTYKKLPDGSFTEFAPSGGGISPPSGTIPISQNGIYNVSEFANADVQVKPEGFVFDNYDENGYPTRLRFFPNAENTEIPSNLFQTNRYDKNSILTKIKTVELLPGTTKISNSAFYNSKSIENILLPNTLLIIEQSAFEYTSISSIIIPESVISIGNYIIRSCSNLEHIEFECDNIIIGYYYFAGTALKEIICKKNVSKIYPEAFPDTMELYDFSHCTSVPVLDNINSIQYSAGCIIRVPQSLLAEWQEATNWCDLVTDQTAEKYIIWEGV